jgi:phosphoglycolate phosphatase-like HAD superfamily hydrolase
MLITIMRHYRVSPDETVFVGNHEVDREAAARAGVAYLSSESLFSGAAVQA